MPPTAMRQDVEGRRSKRKRDEYTRDASSMQETTRSTRVKEAVPLENEGERLSTSTQSHGSRSSQLKQKDAVTARRDISEEGSQGKFRHLKQRKRYIPQDTVTSKWATPGPLVQTAVVEILRGAKRQVLLPHGRGETVNEANSTLSSIVRRLEDRLPRMPFPPHTKEDAFNIEKSMDNNRRFESLVVSEVHTVDLLDAQLERETLATENEKQELSVMQSNVRDQELNGRQRASAIHLLLREETPRTLRDGSEQINLVIDGTRKRMRSHHDMGVSSAAMDQLKNHVESMQDNYTQVAGVDEALQRLSTALDELLHQHVHPQSYHELAVFK